MLIFKLPYGSTKSPSTPSSKTTEPNFFKPFTMIKIREAIAADSDALVALTSSLPMKGTISLRIDRSPNFFLLLKQRGDHIVLLAEDNDKNIIGSFSATKQMFCVDGISLPVYYLGDLKVDQLHSKTLLAYKIVNAMYQELKRRNADLVFCTAAEGNFEVMPLFDGRVGIPLFKKMTSFSVFQLLPKKSTRLATVKDYNDTTIAGFYRNFYRRYNFYPEINLGGCKHFVTRENELIKASVSVFDPTSLKQNVVIDYPFNVAITLFLLKKLSLLFSLPPLPAKKLPLRILYVKHFGFTDEDGSALIDLLQQVRHFAFENNYHFVSIAVDERDKKLIQLIKPYSRFVFHSSALLTSMQNNEELVNQLCEGISYEDYSLV